MNLDFLDVLSQPNQMHREQVGTAGTGGIHANLNVPSTSPASGNTGNKIPAPTANPETCSHVFPVCSQGLGTERPNVDAAVPAVPGVPDENVQFGNAETGVLAEQETAKKQMLRWIDARCAWSQGVWGSEESLFRDYVQWCRKNSLPPCSKELFSAVLDESFQRELDGWQGLCLAVDVAAGGLAHARRPATARIQ